MPYSLYDSEAKRFIASIRNYEDRNKCLEDSTKFVFEGLCDREVEDWIKAGDDKEIAINLMNFEIVKHDPIIRS